MNPLPIAKPFLGEEEAQAARETILSGWVTQGPKVREFEESFAGCVGSRRACAVSSGTAALHLALAATGVKPGDVVVTVSHSFIATANAVRHCGAEPVFVDIDSSTFNMDPEQLHELLETKFDARKDGLWYRDAKRLVTPESATRKRAATSIGRLAAILVVHQIGMPADLTRILPLARQYDVPVVEDAACAVGSEIRFDGAWERVGRPHGDVACFSFHPRKVITTGDGGMLTTNDDELDRRFRLLRQHGMSISDLVRHSASDVIHEQYLVTGYNYRMTDIQAAVGLEQLKRLPSLVAERRRLAALYQERLKGIAGLALLAEPSYARSNWQSYAVRLEKAGTQHSLMKFLQEQGIATRRGVMCAHLEPPYATVWPRGCLPESEAATESCVLLPLFPGMAEQDIDRVVGALRRASA